MYWGAAKREARLKCDYTFKSLEQNIHSFLDKSADVTRIRRYFRRAMEYIEAYTKCTDGREVVQEVKKLVEKKCTYRTEKLEYHLIYCSPIKCITSQPLKNQLQYSNLSFSEQISVRLNPNAHVAMRF